MELKKITLLQLFRLPGNEFDQYDSALRHLVPKPLKTRGATETIKDLTFGEVVQVKRAATKPSFTTIVKAFCITFNIKEKNAHNLGVVEFYHALAWLKQEITELMDNEKNNLSADPDPQMEEAGVARLAIFGEMNTLIMLGKEYGVPPMEVEGWKYMEVFAMVLHNKITREIDKEYRRITAPKPKNQ